MNEHQELPPHLDCHGHSEHDLPCPPTGGHLSPGVIGINPFSATDLLFEGCTSGADVDRSCVGLAVTEQNLLMLIGSCPIRLMLEELSANPG